MRNKTLTLSTLVIIIFFISNAKGVAMSRKLDRYAEIKEKFKQIDISDEVNKEEAIIIAQNYVIDKIEKEEIFFRKLGISNAQLSEDPSYKDKFKENWVILFPMRFGFLKTWNVIYVNKQTGKVLDGGPIK